MHSVTGYICLMNETYLVQRMRERGFWDSKTNSPDFDALAKATGLSLRRLGDFRRGLRPGKHALHALTVALRCKEESLLLKTAALTA